MPSFSPIQDSRFYFNYHHTAADTLDKIVPKELAENSAVVAVAAYALANMEPRTLSELPASGMFDVPICFLNRLARDRATIFQ